MQALQRVLRVSAESPRCAALIHSVAPTVLVTKDREKVDSFKRLIRDRWEVTRDFVCHQTDINEHPPQVYHVDEYDRIKSSLWDYDSERPPFDISAFLRRLTTNRHGHAVVYAPVLSSTQAVLNKRFRGIDCGLVCITQVQTNGSGRGKNMWQSPYGCLMFSFKSSMKSVQYLAMIQYLISLAIVNTIERIPFCKDLDIGIKWPNDIYANKSKKICGILCQSELCDSEYIITSGVGVNLSNSLPSTCIQDLVNAKFPDNPPKINHERFLADFLNQYAVMWRIFREKGFGFFIPEYTRRWLHTDQTVRVHDGSRESEVVITGLSENGYLLAREADGTKHELLPDGNHFDFFHGLISKRLP